MDALPCTFCVDITLPPIDVVKFLIENGVEVAARELEGWTALHLLCRYYTHDNLIIVINLLIDNGVDVATKQRYDWNALHFVCLYHPHENLIEIVNLLLDRGTDPQLETMAGHTAFDLSKKLSSYEHENKPKLLEILSRKNGKIKKK